MPQMAPIKWLTLFMLFSFIYFLFLMTNYFNYSINFLTKKSFNKYYKSKNSMNWKW